MPAGRAVVTAQVDSALSNISFTGGITAFDNRLTNARGAFSIDTTIYIPIEFQVVCPACAWFRKRPDDVQYCDDAGPAKRFAQRKRRHANKRRIWHKYRDNQSGSGTVSLYRQSVDQWGYFRCSPVTRKDKTGIVGGRSLRVKPLRASPDFFY